MAGHETFPTPPSSAARRAARRREAAVAGHRGDVRLLEAYSEDGDPVVRAISLSGLERCGALDDAPLRSALEDDDAIVRVRAAELSADHPSVSLLAALEDPAPDVVETAAWACGERPATRGEELEALCRVASDHEDPLCREAAVAALGAIGDVAALPVILAATRDKVAIRRRAVLALAPFEGPEVEAALARATQDRDWQVRQAAEDLVEPG